jgi:hypothetical protein
MRILAEQWPLLGPLTTGAVADALQMTREGVRYLVRDRQIACQQTRTKLRLFRPDDVWRLADQRTKARAAGKLPPRRKLGPRGEPRQMSLLGAGLRIVGGRDRRADVA